LNLGILNLSECGSIGSDGFAGHEKLFAGRGILLVGGRSGHGTGSQRHFFHCPENCSRDFSKW
jgi:hypothetical protein